MGAADTRVVVITGAKNELRIAAEGLAFTTGGIAAGEARDQVARCDEVAEVRVEPAQRRMVVRFTDQRPEWKLAGVAPEQVEWAGTVLRDIVRRARARSGAEFTQPLHGEALRQAITGLSTPPAGDPSLLAELLLHQAVGHGATDLHLQPTATGYAARLRVDGQLGEMGQVPTAVAQRAVARLKVLGGMPTYVRHTGQSGRVTLTADGRLVDIRLTTLPTIHGEKLTARLFDPARQLMSLEALGMDPAVEAAYRRHVEQPRGCILLTGPAGSGKSTTLYASLRHLAGLPTPRSLTTVEDPVEFALAGVDQTEVNRAVGLDFAEGLRTVLRQDPQAIMVGEVRDVETAEIAIQAGLTGHVVFSTVHAPSTAGVFARLADLGLEPYLIASSVTAVMSQRLVRKLCPGCAAAYRPDEQELKDAGLQGADLAGFDLRQPRGCEACGGSGYGGRTGIFELLPVTPQIQAAVTERRTALEIQAVALGQGLATLWDAGLERVRQGLTSLAELTAVLGRRYL